MGPQTSQQLCPREAVQQAPQRSYAPQTLQTQQWTPSTCEIYKTRYIETPTKSSGKTPILGPFATKLDKVKDLGFPRKKNPTNIMPKIVK